MEAEKWPFVGDRPSGKAPHVDSKFGTPNSVKEPIFSAARKSLSRSTYFELQKSSCGPETLQPASTASVLGPGPRTLFAGSGGFSK